MIETLVKRATCSIHCGDGQGTGWLVTNSLVITAYHCIFDSIDNNAPIILKFEIDGEPKEVKATLKAADQNNDICILVSEQSLNIEPLSLSQHLPPEGSEFFSYGFPITKLSVGHIVRGEVSQVLERPKLKMDLDLHVEQSSSLTDFKGISGSALMCKDRCIGVLRLSVDKSLGAISIARIADFLRDNQVPVYESSTESPEENFVSRATFTKDFEDLIENIGHGYAFIGGSQGIGKSTFCRLYRSSKANLIQFATYSFTSRDGVENAMHKALPEVFYDWLSAQVSSHLMGKAARVSQKSYREIIEGITNLISNLAESFQEQRKTGIIFIDGLDEVASISMDVLTKFINIFPERLPRGVVFVFSAPSYDRLEKTLSSRVNESSCITMPRLEHGAVRSYCFSQLSDEYSNTEVVSVICDRVQGHPLYLHYLIELANSGKGSSELAQLPLINGSIRNYYDVIWSRLKAEPIVVELLAIITRLRWGLQLPSFSDVLAENEKAALNGALPSIKHLLRSNEIAIYHSSFSDYISDKTELRDKDIHLRLSQYCISRMTTRYGLLNVMYHSVRSGNQNQDDFAVVSCDQCWVDKCVTEGVEPDLLLHDLQEVLARAIERGSLKEVIRLLLLSHRLTFRYNTLFALSAELIGGALISLGKPKEALQHVVRYGRLIIDIQESLWLASKLVEAGEHEAVLNLLEKAEITNEKIFDASSCLSIENFFIWYENQIHIQTLKNVAGDTDARVRLQNTISYSMQLISQNIEDEEVRQAIILDLLSIMLTCSLCFESRYTPISIIRKRVPLDCQLFLQTLIQVIVNYSSYCDIYEVSLNRNLLQSVFSDIQELLDGSEESLEHCTIEAVDTLISLGAPISIVASVSKNLNGRFQSEFFSIFTDEKISIDKSKLRLSMASIRVMAFLDSGMSCPSFPHESQYEWRKKAELLFRTLAWAEGITRRAKKEKDGEKLLAVWQILEDEFFGQLNFTLSQRVEWKNSYALPEELFLILYSTLTDFIIDVYPEKLSILISFIDRQFSTQCGIYSEGFRRILAEVLNKLSKVNLSDNTEDQAFNLLQRWYNFSLRNVKNRHELVPELLSIIPLFIKFDAPELANNIYQSVLGHSMGPTWYKEDQLSLLVDTLITLPSDEKPIPSLLSSIAGILEAASGEMTFQRYVRFDKARLIEGLCNLKNFDKAVKYFARQVCGTGEQLFSDVTEDDIDRISPLRGSRYPGGALDEQDAILKIIEAAIPHVDWRLSWSLLEVYQFGDWRYLNKFASQYARLALSNNIENHNEMAERLRWICESELEEKNKENFLEDFFNSFSEELPEAFQPIRKLLNQTLTCRSNDAAKNIVRSADIPQDPDTADYRSHRDKMVMPGIFGTESSNLDCKEAVRKADKLLVRGNRLAAQKEALQALRYLQVGGWSIWGTHSEEAERAREIIYQTSETVTEFVKAYAPLILSEKYVELWRSVSHLISFLGDKVTPEERGQVLLCVIEHCELMVGDVSAQSKKFAFLENDQMDDATSSLFRLLAYLIEHPNWNIRSKAAEMIFWLCNKDANYISMLVPIAFSMSSDIAPDLLCGILEMLSKSDIHKVWNGIITVTGVKEFIPNCQHAGRISTILHIAKKASSEGLKDAEEVCNMVRNLIQSSSEIPQHQVKEFIQCPDWCLVAERQWKELNKMGLATSSLAKAAKAILQNECAPLSIEDTYEIELMLADRFRGNANHPQGRWMAKVRYSLLVALCETVPVDSLSLVTKVFKAFNPSKVDKVRIAGSLSPSLGWYQSIKNNKLFKPMHRDELYLDFVERVWIKDENRWRLIRLTAFMFERGRKPSPPDHFSSFKTTEEPELNAPWPETCSRGEYWPTFLGSFTPAHPSSLFAQLAELRGNDFKRAYWREGRTPESFSRDYIREGCYLSVNANRIRLPQLVCLAWLCEIDGRPASIISFGG
ncbi:trypsin-like peptidase domain-containing protein [Vibrio cholerae]|uniref:AVAST type 1 anti-phage system protease Avs1b n=1 Tax=Vibrio cholerae TaxID=666 RepID=UPI000C710B02|nr:AVAST type 1 anti-phage system protease Avs1b [Vibrio cholerae]EGR2848367.1 serine protease [Vibrio cholerae]EGR4343644.1 serine protease [Vibrio cholerae]EII2378598.1 trypsin-like peptidase domain-containing protein [Vibrio cholerae]EJF0911579.1 trypsin-like peptidase domain-containing protein [Vibrio cholerae]EJL6916005.1 trypsin-like peptidase domain-containing protein [Vibrio cholerae]